MAAISIYLLAMDRSGDAMVDVACRQVRGVRAHGTCARGIGEAVVSESRIHR